ncbi:MAG: hypothetical protein CMQ40_10820 [Gammaproteobacteria bacterium]|nr:hypothetical protein [Gammaproteobacteria bacterium]
MYRENDAERPGQIRMDLNEGKLQKFDQVDAERRRQAREKVVRPGGLEAAPKKRRWNPIGDGKVGLVQFSNIPVDAAGNLQPEKKTNSVSASGKATVIAGIHKGRWIWRPFLLEGPEKVVERDRMFLKRAMSCHTLDLDDLSYADLEGLVVPVRFKVVPHWRTGKPSNDIVALSADPRSVTYRDYLKLIGRFEDAVPGWNLYPGTRARSLVEKRKKERTEIAGWIPIGLDPKKGELVRRVPNEDSAKKDKVEVLFGPPRYVPATRQDLRKLKNSHLAVEKMKGEKK